MSNLPAAMSDGKLESPAPILTLDAAGEFAAGATVLAAYWPKDLPQQVFLKTRDAGRREIIVPRDPAMIDRAVAILTQWADMGTGASASARILRQRIRSEAGKLAISVLS